MAIRIFFGNSKDDPNGKDWGVEFTGGGLDALAFELAEALVLVADRRFTFDDAAAVEATADDFHQVLRLAIPIAFKTCGYKQDDVREFRIMRAGTTPNETKLICENSVVADANS